ncbi:MAG: hypothetical protein U0527_08530 [Candidatus Eisenbacteria bacterium]
MGRVTVLVLLGIGAVGVMRRDALALTTATLVLGSCFWPPIWAGTRFLVPIVPLLYLLWLSGLEVTVDAAFPSARQARLRTGMIATMLAISVLLGLKNLAFYFEERKSYPPEWRNYFEALRWVRDNLPRDVVLVDRKPNFVQYVAERKGVTFPRQKDPDLLIDAVVAKGATHLLLSSLPYDDIFRYLEPTVKARQPYFKLMHSWAEPATYVTQIEVEAWREHRAGAPSPPSSGEDPGSDNAPR